MDALKPISPKPYYRFDVTTKTGDNVSVIFDPSRVHLFSQNATV